MTLSTLPPDFEISTDPARLDVALVERVLSQTYWAQGRSRDTIERSIANSLPFAAYASGQQIAFARVVTDRAVFAWLADVFVVPEFKGYGVSKALMATILAHPELQGLKLFLLRTRDAHGLYAQFGFVMVDRPEEIMWRFDGSR